MILVQLDLVFFADYDGGNTSISSMTEMQLTPLIDEEFIIPDTMIVEPFQNKPLTPMPPNLIRDNFEKHVETVTDFAHRVMALPSQDAQIAFQEVLLLGLTNAQIGLYSKFHDYAVWKFGYDDPRTIRLAYM